MRTLPDYLRPGLAVVSIGLNPSPASVAAGYYFAHPRNRFWPALNGSRLYPGTLAPGPGAIEWLFRERGMGFTDVVKRPTPGSGALRAADYRRWAPGLRRKLALVRPRVAWFHGRVAANHYLRHGEGRGAVSGWGCQGRLDCGARLVITPNPSPANAAFSLAQLIAAYDRLAAVVEAADG